MATKTRSIIPTLVVVAVVAAVAYIGQWGDGTDAPIRHDNEEHIIWEVRFTPSPSHQGINILVYVENVQVIDYIAATSPWTHKQWVPKGAQVSVNAQQMTPGMVMCTITSNGHVRDTKVIKDEPGSVRCWHNRPPAAKH